MKKYIALILIILNTFASGKAQVENLDDVFRISLSNVSSKFENLKSKQLNAREWSTVLPSVVINGLEFTPLVYNEGDNTFSLKWAWNAPLGQFADGNLLGFTIQEVMNKARSFGLPRWENTSNYKDGTTYIHWYGYFGDDCLFTIQSTTNDVVNTKPPQTKGFWLTFAFWYQE